LLPHDISLRGVLWLVQSLRDKWQRKRTASLGCCAA